MIFHVIELRKLDETSEEEQKKELYRWARMIASKSWEAICVEAKDEALLDKFKKA